MPVEDPRVVRSRAAILDAAARVFLDHGYTAARVDDVAEAAGVAKRTVYNLYADKEALFRATALSSIAIAERFSASLADEVHAVDDARAGLPTLGVRLAESVLIGQVMPLRRLLVMESERFPDLAAEYRRRAPDAVMTALTELFTRLVDAGSLRGGDPSVMTEHFAFLVMGADMDRGMFGIATPPARVRARALAGVEVFLTSYLVG